MEEQEHPKEYLYFLKYVNEQDYFTAHEVLEGYWHSERIDFYKGLIQLAVGLYHLGTGNIAGVHALFGRACELLEPYRPEFRAMDVERIVRYMQDCMRRIPKVATLERAQVRELQIEPIQLRLLDGTPIPADDWKEDEADDV